MRNAFLVALREYVENAKTKGFWISIFMLPLILFLSFQIPVFLEKKGTPTRYFVLVDRSGELEEIIEKALDENHQRQVLQALNQYARSHARPLPPFVQQFSGESSESVAKFIELGGQNAYLEQLRPDLRADAPPFQEPRVLFRRVPLAALGLEPSSDLVLDLRPFLRGEKTFNINGASARLDAAILIPREISTIVARPGSAPSPSTNGIEYWSGNLTDKSLRNLVDGAVNREIRRREYLARGLDIAQFREVENTRVQILELNPRKDEGDERVSRAEVLAQWAPVGFVYLLWIAIFSISQMLLSNTIEEKSNRIIEVLLSSVTPGEFIIGKLAGIAAVGLTMVSAWIGSLIAIIALKSSGQSEIAMQFAGLLRGSHLVPAFIIYFFFGYLLYAGIILAIGSVCNTLKEAQNYMGVITLLMIVPLLTMMFIPKDPNGTVATVLSWIPIYTPFIMMNRAAADPPLFDLIGTMLLLAVSTVLVLWCAVKIFRAAVLRTGQPPRIIELIRWLRGD